MIRYPTLLLCISVLFCLLAETSVSSEQKLNILRLDNPIIIDGEKAPDDVNRAILALVLKLRGYSEHDAADIGVRFSKAALGNIPNKMELLDGLVLQDVQFSLLMPGAPPGKGRRMAGQLLFENEFFMRAELAFAIDYQAEGDGLIIKGAGVGENSPMPPHVSSLIVPSEKVPADFWQQYPGWQDTLVFALSKRVKLDQPNSIQKGTQNYHIFHFIHEHLPRNDWTGLVTHDDAQGVKGDTGNVEQKNWDGWRVLVAKRALDLRSGKPLYFKTLYAPTATGIKEMNGKMLQLFTFTPMNGGQVIINATDSTTGIDATTVKSSVDDAQKKVNLALNRPTLVSSTSIYSKHKDITKDGGGAVDGDKHRGMYGFHTNKENSPWWQVDLGEGAVIQEIKVYNRASDAGRARTMRVLLSDDGKMWRQVHDQGGKSFSTLKVPLNRVSARYLRLQLSEKNWFHLDEVEVLGTRGNSVSQSQPSEKESTAPPAGHWSSSEWKARLDFWQQDDRLLSYYRTDNDTGWLWASKSGNAFDGWWVESSSNEKCASQKGGTYYWGKVRLSFTGDRMSGVWGYCDKPMTRKWSGTRLSNALKHDKEPRWELFSNASAKPKEQDNGRKTRMIPGKMSPLSDDGRVRLEVIDPKEGFRLINEIVGYSFLPPFDNWRIAKPEPTGRIIIRDQGSCAMSFVPGNLVPGNPGTSLTPRQLEKHWFQQMVQGGDSSISRSSFGPVTIAGYPAYFGSYDTNEGALKSYFIKLPHTYLVAGFKCDGKQLNSQLAKFEKALTTLKALPGAKAPKPTAAATAPDSKTQTAAIAKPAVSAKPGTLSKTFAEPGFGYTMPYPDNWHYAKEKPWTVVFSGANGTDSYFTTVTVQNISAQEYPDMQAVIADLKSQLEQGASPSRWLTTLAYLHMDDGGNVIGKQFLMEFTLQGEKMRRIGVLIPRDKLGLYHYWSYTAPVALYNSNLALAEKIRNGIVLTSK